MHGIFPLVKKTDAQDPAYRPTHPPFASLACAGRSASRVRAHRGNMRDHAKALSSASRARPLASGTRCP
jgi:hypothetical protein